MNDFTKEELQFISDYIYLGVRDIKNNKLLTSVDNKIQSMIDNYPKPEEPISHKYIFKAEDVSWLIKKVKDE